MNKTIISTFTLFGILALIALFSTNSYLVLGAAFFAGAFFFVGIGLINEEKEMMIDTLHIQYNDIETFGVKEPSFKSKLSGETKRMNKVVKK